MVHWLPILLHHVPSPNPVVVVQQSTISLQNNGRKGKVIVLVPIKFSGEYVEMTLRHRILICSMQYTDERQVLMMITAADGGAGVHMNIHSFNPSTVTNTEDGNKPSLYLSKVYANYYITCDPPFQN